MNRFPLRLCAALLGAAVACGHSFAETDVDQADSLRFQEFFKDKKDAVKVWKDDDGNLDAGKRTETIKTYELTPAAPAQTAAPAVPNDPPAAATAAGEQGQRFEIRERYALGRSADTPYSAFYVIEALHKQSAQLCPRGWKKLGERSEPVAQDFFLYYELECL